MDLLEQLEFKNITYPSFFFSCYILQFDKKKTIAKPQYPHTYLHQPARPEDAQTGPLRAKQP